jgi:hypothetical protein
MKPQIIGLRVAGTLFGLLALGQLMRLLFKPAVFIGTHQIPLWPSGLAVAVFAGLCLWLWNLSNRAA